MNRIAIIGGGISGLSAAFALGNRVSWRGESKLLNAKNAKEIRKGR
jgi:protoporphyrinogen oxidase